MTRTIVVGMGRSGLGAARLLKQQNRDVVVFERGDNDALQQIAKTLGQEGIQVALGQPLTPESFQTWRDGLDAVVIGPGIPWDHPTLLQLRSDGIQVRGEMDLAWDALRQIPWIGITGTNGKTTVTHLLSHVLESSGLKAPMGGNMGLSAAELACQIASGATPQPDWLVMELSSYQIEAAPAVAPKIGIWTTLTPDHLERHGSLEAYRAIKRGLLERSQCALFNADDPDLRQQRSSWQHGTWVSGEGARPDGQPADLWIDAEGMVRNSTTTLFAADVLAMPGSHNRQNLLLVTAAALAVGLSPQQIAASLSTFPGVPHRLEHLGTLAGANVFNDSKATNYDAAEVGLKAMQGPVVVLAGGQTKRGDASGWMKTLETRACSLILFGTGAEELANLAKAAGYPGELLQCQELETAVNLAAVAVQRQGASALLLSPACASFDQYRDFEARGEHFRALVQPFLDAA